MQHFNGLSLLAFMAMSYSLVNMPKMHRTKFAHFRPGVGLLQLDQIPMVSTLTIETYQRQ